MINNKNNNWCRTCGKEFYSCDSCQQVKEYTPWRVLCDTKEHYQIYMAFIMHRDGVMSESETRDSLKRMGVTVSEIKTFIPAIRDVFLPIMEEKEKIVEVKDVDTADNISNESEEIEEEVKEKD